MVIKAAFANDTDLFCDGLNEVTHDDLLEIIDWTKNETPHKHRSCGELEKHGEQVPQDY